LGETSSAKRTIGLLRAAAAIAFVLVIVLGVLAWWSARHGGVNVLEFAPTAKGIEAEIKSWGQWALAGSIVLMVAHSLVPFPAEFVTFANGMLFGPVWGTLITWTGAMLGAALAFGLARWFGRPFVYAIMNERHRVAVDEWVRRQGIGVLLFSRLMPLISFNVINYAAGLTPISWWTFLWTTGIGILPISILMVVTGDQLSSGQGSAWIYLLAVVGIGGLLLFVYLRRRQAAE
jgi:uncharacterized membrane protein YdjX (TVP38/TMEM64 family)